jgi:thiol-disulfide isomerase/thioredoxin
MQSMLVSPEPSNAQTIHSPPKMNSLRTLLAATVLACLPTLGADAAAAHIGDAAPPLNIAYWAKGTPVDLAKAKGKEVVVVEFWATWCGPCLQSIPHLTEMQKHFKSKGVVFVGISDEDQATVATFVKKMGDKMDYVVAVDNQKKTGEGYMKAFDIRGIPHAFVVGKEGSVLWQGHPMAGLDKVLERVVNGRFDTSVAKKLEQVNQWMDQFYNLAGPGKEDDKVDSLGQMILEQTKGIEDLFDGKFDPASTKKTARVEYLVDQYQLVLKQGNEAAAEEFGKQIE